MDIDAIKQLAIEFRAALERCDQEALPVQFRDFPAGSCGDASLLLGTFLNERGAGNFSYVCGMRGDGPDRISHAWIEGEGVIADITADQFPEIDCPVIVATQSSWHDTFERETAHDADFRIFKDAASAVLAGAYAAILKAL